MSPKAAGRSNKKLSSSTRGAPASSAPQTAVAYGALARRLAGHPRVTLPAQERGKFGNNALKVDGKIFAMLVKGALAVKLPPAEIESATIAGLGTPLSMGRRVMKEWLLVNEAPGRWYAAAERARAFVAGEGGEAPASVRAPRAGTASGRERGSAPRK